MNKLSVVIGVGVLVSMSTYAFAEALVSPLGVWDMNAIDQARAQYAQNPQANAAITSLKKNADKELAEPIHTVMDKKVTPPSGDKHDYMSISKYWWPDPSKPNGLPYISKDGQVNPQNDIDEPDRANVEKMGKVVKSLALAYYITGNQQDGQKAVEWLRAWFIDPATRMNPNLQYAISVPGLYDGHENGCIEVHFMAEMLDAVTLLHKGGAMTDPDFAAMHAWSEQFLNWLVTSKHGRAIAKGKQNISTWYDTEVMSLGLFTGQDKLAKEEAEKAKERRIDSQLSPDGTLPQELKRTKSLGYSMFDLEALEELAQLASRTNINLWDYQSPEGASLKKSIDFHLPYVFGGESWPHQEIHGFKPDEGFAVLYQAAAVYGAKHYEPFLQTAQTTSPNNIARLIYAAPR